MNKLEAAEEMAKAVELLLGAETYLCYFCHQKNYEHSQGCAKKAALMALTVYQQAPAIPPLEKILEAMETLRFISQGGIVLPDEKVRAHSTYVAFRTAVWGELKKAVSK